MAEISTDILVTCADENRRGGIKRIFVASRSNVTSFTAGALQDYTAVTMDATSDVWYEIQVMDEGASIAGEPSKENGSSMVEYVIEASIPKLDKTKAFALQALFTSCKMVAIVETYINTGTYNQAFVVGYDEILGKDAALECAVGTTLEAELQGQNAYTLTMTGSSAEQLREFVGSFTSNASGTINTGS
jgi:hypothetical protein